MWRRSGKIDSRTILVGDGGKKLVLFLLGILFCVVGFLFEPLQRILQGMACILIEPGNLFSDYFCIGGRGASFFNSGILTILFTSILVYYEIPIRGISIASIFTVAGFAFFGKNLVNVWFILAGVRIYAWSQKESFLKYVYIAFFGTALSPLVSQLMFALDLPFFPRIALGASAGISAGFFLPSLTATFLSLHRGYNLYNIGFSAGMLGTLFVSLLRSHGLVFEMRFVWSTEPCVLLLPFFAGLFSLMVFAGYFLNGMSFKGVGELWKHSGRLLADFVDIFDFPPVLVNMGANGLIAISYLWLVGGDFNGPTIGGVLTIVGFSAMGKTPRNIIPILIGVTLGGATRGSSLNDPSLQMAALFGTTLAPIAGEFGWKAGLFAGYVHSSVVLYVGTLHAGVNLYNNGFAGGLVAAMLVPIFEAFWLKRD